MKKYQRMQLDQLEELHKQHQARKARVSSLKFRNDLLKMQDINTQRSEYNRIRAAIENKLIPNHNLQTYKDKTEEIQKNIFSQYIN